MSEGEYTGSSAPGSTAQGSRPQLGHLLLVLVLASILLFLLVDDGGIVPRRETPAGPLSVAGFEGSVELVDGSRIAARLSRLHSTPARQAFDAKALRRRFDLSPGEAWRLELERSALPANRSGDQVAGFPLSSVAIRGDGDLELRPLVSDRPELSPREVADPLAELFDPADRSLAEGGSRQLILWGELEAPVRLLIGAAAPGEHELHAVEILTEALPAVIARGLRDDPASMGSGGSAR